MTPDEFIDYMIDKVLKNKLLRKMISDKQAEGLYFIREEMDAVLAAPDIPLAQSPADTLKPCQEAAVPVDSPLDPEPSPLPAVLPAPAEAAVPAAPEATPMERLAEMYASGHKYSAEQIYKALHRAQI